MLSVVQYEQREKGLRPDRPKKRSKFYGSWCRQLETRVNLKLNSGFLAKQRWTSRLVPAPLLKRTSSRWFFPFRERPAKLGMERRPADLDGPLIGRLTHLQGVRDIRPEVPFRRDTNSGPKKLDLLPFFFKRRCTSLATIYNYRILRNLEVVHRHDMKRGLGTVSLDPATKILLALLTVTMTTGAASAQARTFYDSAGGASAARRPTAAAPARIAIPEAG
jgi:hypothetical protein